MPTHQLTICVAKPCIFWKQSLDPFREQHHATDKTGKGGDHRAIIDFRYCTGLGKSC